MKAAMKLVIVSGLLVAGLGFGCGSSESEEATQQATSGSEATANAAQTQATAAEQQAAQAKAEAEQQAAQATAAAEQAAAQAPVAQPQEKDIIDTASAAPQFSTFVKLVQASGLAETLKGQGPFTVFAPTDEAFAKLPKGEVEKLMKPENKDKLAAILKYHIVSGEVKAADVAALKSAKTVNGKSIKISAKNDQVTVNKSKVLSTDIQASNGVIHTIDTVLMPKGK